MTAVQSVDAMYKSAEAAGGGSALLHLFIAQHYAMYHSNMHLEIVHLRIAEVRACSCVLLHV
jgi:hypothetical protein